MSEADPVRIVSYATPEYFVWAQRLAHSCTKLGLTLELHERPSRGNWWSNVARKPAIMREAIDGEPFYWVDADAVVLQRPRLFEQHEFDFAASRRQRRGNESLSVREAFRSGTMAFRPSARVVAMLDAWVESVARFNRHYDEEAALFDVWDAMGDTRPSWLALPETYMTVGDSRQRWSTIGWDGRDSTYSACHRKLPRDTVVAHHHTKHEHAPTITSR